MKASTDTGTRILGGRRDSVFLFGERVCGNVEAG